MYKFVFLLFLVLAATTYSFLCKEAKRVEISKPAISGSPILVLNQ